MDAPEYDWWDDITYARDIPVVGNWYWDSDKKQMLLKEEDKEKWTKEHWQEKWKEHEQELTRFLVLKKLQGEGG